MKVPGRLNARRLAELFIVVMILAGAWLSHAATAQEEKAVEGFPAVLQRDITLWSDGTRLSGILLYPKDREEGEKLPALVMCNGWGGTKAFLMRSGIAPRFAAAGYVVINYDYRGWGDSDSRLVVRDEIPKPDEDGYVTVKAQAIREVVDPIDQQKDIDAAISYVYGEPMVDKDRIGIWGTSFGGGHVIYRAAHDSRVACVVAQVGSMPDDWTKRYPAGLKKVYEGKSARARGDIERRGAARFTGTQPRCRCHADARDIVVVVCDRHVCHVAGAKCIVEGIGTRWIARDDAVADVPVEESVINSRDSYRHRGRASCRQYDR